MDRPDLSDQDVAARFAALVEGHGPWNLEDLDDPVPGDTDPAPVLAIDAAAEVAPADATPVQLAAPGQPLMAPTPVGRGGGQVRRVGVIVSAVATVGLVLVAVGVAVAAGVAAGPALAQVSADGGADDAALLALITWFTPGVVASLSAVMAVGFFTFVRARRRRRALPALRATGWITVLAVVITAAWFAGAWFAI